MSNRDKWRAWRKDGIGASDAPIIMGVSLFKTPYKLWVEKVSELQPEESNWITDKGNELEPKARAMYELEHGIECPPLLTQHATHPWLRASLDGYNAADGGTVLEIKYVGKADLALANEGKVPDKYWPQVQHQLMVTGAARAHYYSFDGQAGVTVEVLPDPDYVFRLFQAEQKFWNLVTTKVPPPLGDRDTRIIKLKKAKACADRYATLCADLKAQERLVAEAKAELLLYAKKHPRAQIGVVSVARTWRNGNIDYKAVPELKGVDLEPYRKDGSEVVTLRVTNEVNTD